MEIHQKFILLSKLMKRFLLLTILIPTISCKTEIKKSITLISEPEVVKRFNYKITVDIWNGFFGYESRYVLNNLRIYNYDSSDARVPLSKPLTLYYVSFTSVQDNDNRGNRTLVPNDTTAIPFSKDLSDTLFILAKNALHGIEFRNIDTVGKSILIFEDDSHGLIELSDDNLKVSAMINSIQSMAISFHEMDTLLNFVRKFRTPSKNKVK